MQVSRSPDSLTDRRESVSSADGENRAPLVLSFLCLNNAESGLSEKHRKIQQPIKSLQHLLLKCYSTSVQLLKL